MKGLKMTWLVGEGNHNWSYDTTDNHDTMSHPRVNGNSKTNSNPKNERMIEQEKNKDVEYTSFQNEIIETIDKTECISMSERENLTKVKIKKSQELYDDIELNMNDVSTMLYAFAKNS